MKLEKDFDMSSEPQAQEHNKEHDQTGDPS